MPTNSNPYTVPKYEYGPTYIERPHTIDDKQTISGFFSFDALTVASRNVKTQLWIVGIVIKTGY